MKYFAYGSNLNPKRLADRDVQFSSRKPAKLEGYKLVFNKKAQAGDFAYANIEPAINNEIVEGAVYELDDDSIAQLDEFEGYPNHYQKKEIEVLSPDGERIKATVYVANEGKIVNGLKPKREYLNHILAGRDIFSKEYFDSISKTETID